jgi:ATP-dependent Clp protease, protease subunit
MHLERPLTQPMIQRYRDYARQRQMTLGDLLLENRIIFLEGVINDAAANLAVMKFLFLQYENRSQGISFYVNSPGGSVTSTLAIYDTMQFIGSKVATTCVGQAASTAALLLAGGASGSRMLLPHARVVLHQPSGGGQGALPDLALQAKEIVRLRAEMELILSQHTGQPVERLREDTGRDLVLNAQEAVAYGVADGVLDSRKAVPAA